MSVAKAGANTSMSVAKAGANASTSVAKAGAKPKSSIKKLSVTSNKLWPSNLRLQFVIRLLKALFM